MWRIAASFVGLFGALLGAQLCFAQLTATGIGGGGFGGSAPAVTVDALGTGAATTTATTFTYGPGGTQGITIGTGNALVVALELLNVVSSSVTWNGVSLTQIGSDVSGGVGDVIRFYGLLSPASGNQNLVITVGANTPLAVFAMSFNNVNSTFGTAFSNLNSAADGTNTHNTLSVNITNGGTGHYIFGLADGFNAATLTVPTDTLLGSPTTHFGIQQGFYSASSGSPHTSTMNVNINDSMTIAGFDVSP